MLRTALAVTLVTAASLGAQSQQPQPQRLSQADSAAILKAARARVTKRDSTVTPDEIELRADTAWVAVWVREGRYGRDGHRVRVERRAGQWVAVKSIQPAVGVRYPAPADTLTARDSVEIQRAARDHLKSDSPVARLYSGRGDTVHVHVGDHISWTLVRVVRRNDQWVAVKDSIEVRGIR